MNKTTEDHIYKNLKSNWGQANWEVISHQSSRTHSRERAKRLEVKMQKMNKVSLSIRNKQDSILSA